MIYSTGVDLTVIEVKFTEAQADSDKDHHLMIKVKNEFSNGSAEPGHRFIHVFGKYAKTLHDRGTIKVGGEISLNFESRNVSRVNKDTGKREYVEEWSNPQNIRCKMPKVAAPQTTVTREEVDSGLDTETF